MKPRPLKRCVIKEELVALTDDYKLAIILNQMLYWSKRVDDFDEFILEERQRTLDLGEPVPSGIELRKGWIYKAAEELAEETMMKLNASNMLSHLTKLVERGWLERRRNPYNKMDKKYQYRVNILNIQHNLQNMGFALDTYPLLLEVSDDDTYSRNKNTILRNENTPKSALRSFFQNANSNLQNEKTNLQNSGSDLRNTKAITEITTETTLDDEVDRLLAQMQDGPRTFQSVVRSRRPVRSLYRRDIIDEDWKERDNSPPIQCAQDPLGDQTPHSSEGRSVVINDLCKAIEVRMSIHLGRLYVPKKGDYKAVIDFVGSGVPAEFVLDGIDFVFENFKDYRPRSFGYCAKVIQQRWALEREKMSTSTHVYLPTQPTRKKAHVSTNLNGGREKARDERYAEFYKLFPDS